MKCGKFALIQMRVACLVPSRLAHCSVSLYLMFKKHLCALGTFLVSALVRNHHICFSMVLVLSGTASLVTYCKCVLLP